MTGLRLLLVDDEAGLREAIADSLRMRGHWVREAADVPSALDASERERFDVLVTDIRLGRDDGLSLARTIRDRDPEIGIVFITGYGSLELAIGAMRMGASDFIQKPFRLSVLAEAVERNARRDATPRASVDTAAEDAGRASSDEVAAAEPTTADSPDARERRDQRALRDLLWQAPDPGARCDREEAR